MANKFRTVFEQARSNVAFASKLLISDDPRRICAEAQIDLDDAEAKLLRSAIGQSRVYYLERLQLLAIEPVAIASNPFCGAICFSECIYCS